MKNALKIMCLAGIIAFFGMACEDSHEIPVESEGCIIGMIPLDTVYKWKYEDCYKDLIWIEVLNDDDLGKDLKIISVFNGFDPPRPPLEYNNVIQVPIPNSFWETNRKDTLMGKTIYFHYQEIKESDLKLVQNSECSEIYEFYDAPIYQISSLGISNCPPIEAQL